MFRLQEYFKLCLPLMLASCGFGGDNADPLHGRQESYITDSQRVAEEQTWEQKFAVETAEYEASIERINSEAEAALAQQEVNFQNVISGLQQDQERTADEWQSRRNEYVASLEAYQQAQEARDQGYQESVRMLRQQIQTCQDRINNPVAQEFQDFLYQWNMDSAQPLSYEFEFNRQGEHSFTFALLLDHDPSQIQFNVTPDLPQGLTLTADSENAGRWLISGTPTESLENGELSRETHHQIELVKNNIQLASERERELLGQQTVKQEIRIVVSQTQQGPQLVNLVQDGERLEVVVEDPALANNFDPENAPAIIFSGEIGCNPNPNQRCTNMAPFMTLASGPNPTLRNGNVVYHYIIQSSLIPDGTFQGNNRAVVAVKTQSQASGLTSTPVPFDINHPNEEAN